MKYTAIGRAGGVGTFWSGYEYVLGVYRWRWLASLRAWFHVRIQNTWRMSRVEASS